MNASQNETIEGFLATATLYGPRILAAMIAGAVIGLENQIFQKPAGLRTNILLCTACAVLTIISIISGQLFTDSSTRITSMILSGIGFLGGGVILHEHEKVQGITTASTIFVNAAIGITIGTGLIFSGVLLSLIAATVLALLHPVDDWIDKRRVVRELREKKGAVESQSSHS